MQVMQSEGNMANEKADKTKLEASLQAQLQSTKQDSESARQQLMDVHQRLRDMQERERQAQERLLVTEASEQGLKQQVITLKSELDEARHTMTNFEQTGDSA